MFGIDDAELERRRRPVRVRLWVVVLQLLLAAVPCLIAWGVDLVNHPKRVEAILHRRAGGDFAFGFDDFEVLPVGAWYAPWSWQVAVTGFWFKPPDPMKPDWRVERATLPVPELRGSNVGRVIHFPVGRVNGLTIQAHQQRPPEPWTPKATPIGALTAGVVHVLAASFDAPPDPPLGVARAEGIRGTLRDLVFLPGARDVSGKGEVRVARFTTGNIVVTDGVLSTFDLDHSTLRLEGTYRFAEADGWLKGEIRTFHVRSAVDLHTTVRNANLSQVIETATGKPGNLSGRLDLDLRVEAGGERPRGASLLYGNVDVREARIQLGRDTRYLVLDALRLLPWVDLNAKNQVDLRPLKGQIELTRGRVTVQDWRYPVGKRSIRVDGRLHAGDLYLFVRLLPRADRPDGVPLGLLMWGTPDGQQFRMAGPDDLARAEPWIPDLLQPSRGPGGRGAATSKDPPKGRHGPAGDADSSPSTP